MLVIDGCFYLGNVLITGTRWCSQEFAESCCTCAVKKYSGVYFYRCSIKTCFASSYQSRRDQVIFIQVIMHTWSKATQLYQAWPKQAFHTLHTQHTWPNRTLTISCPYFTSKLVAFQRLFDHFARADLTNICCWLLKMSPLVNVLFVYKFGLFVHQFPGHNIGTKTLEILWNLKCWQCPHLITLAHTNLCLIFVKVPVHL